MGHKLRTDVPVQMTKHSKQNSCEQRGISVRSVSRCKQMLHWLSTSSFSSLSGERSSFERDDSGGGDSSFMRLAGGGESCMCDHTAVAGWVMGLLDHFGITRPATPRNVHLLRVYATAKNIGNQRFSVQVHTTTTGKLLPSWVVIPRYSDSCG